MIKVDETNYRFFLITAIEDYGITLKDLGKYLEIQPDLISDYYHERRIPSPASLRKINKLAGIDDEMVVEITGRTKKSAGRNYNEWLAMLDRLNSGDTDSGKEIAREMFWTGYRSKRTPRKPKKTESSTRMKMFRGIFDLNPEEAGEVIGFSRTTVKNIELGLRDLSEDEWESLNEYAKQAKRCDRECVY